MHLQLLELLQNSSLVKKKLLREAKFFFFFASRGNARHYRGERLWNCNWD